MALDIVTLGPWTDGLVVSDPQEVIPHTALALADNVELGPGGDIRQRKGFDTYIDAQLGSGAAITLLGEHRFSASATRKYTICATGFYEDVTGTWTARTGAVSITSATTNYWSAASCGGTLYICSATNGMAKWAAAGGNIAAATVSGRFTAAKMNEYFDSTLWYANTSGGGDESYVWRSDLSAFETVGANNYYLTDAPVTGLKSFGQAIMVHNDKGIWSLTPTGGSTMPYSRQPRSSIGSQAWRSVVTAPNNMQYFVRAEGIYEWNGGTDPQRISGPLDGSRYWDNVNSTYIPFTYAIVHPIKTWVIFGLPYGTAQTTNNHWMIFDYSSRRWFGPYKGFTRNVVAYFDNLPHAGGYDGYVYKHEYGDDDNGAAITWNAKTSGRPPQGLTMQHRWISARHEFERQEVGVSVQITQSSEGVVDNPNTLVVAAQGDTIQGTFTIGISAIAGSSTTLPIDTEMWGWDSGAQLEYYHKQTSVPIALRRVECLYETIEATPLNKFESGVR